MVRSIGADHVIDYTREDFTQCRQKYDLILQLAGTRSPSDCRRALTSKGTLLLCSGESSGRWIGTRGSDWAPAGGVLPTIVLPAARALERGSPVGTRVLVWRSLQNPGRFTAVASDAGKPLLLLGEPPRSHLDGAGRHRALGAGDHRRRHPVPHAEAGGTPRRGRGLSLPRGESTWLSPHCWPSPRPASFPPRGASLTAGAPLTPFIGAKPPGLLVMGAQLPVAYCAAESRPSTGHVSKGRTGHGRIRNQKAITLQQLIASTGEQHVNTPGASFTYGGHYGLGEITQLRQTH
jgi:hypothetical protein